MILAENKSWHRRVGSKFGPGSLERDSAWSLGTNLISRASTLLLLFYAAAVLPRAEFGVLVLAQATVYLIFPFALAGLNLSGTRMAASYAEDDKLAWTVSVQSLQVTLATTIVAVVCTAMGWHWITRIAGREELDEGIRWTSCLQLATLTLSTSVCSVMTGFKRFRVLLWASIAGLVGMAISVPYTIATGGIRGAQVAASICHGATMATVLVHNRRHYKRIFMAMPDFEMWRRLLSVGGPTYFVTILAGVTNYLALSLMARQANGTLDLAAYAVCDRVRQVLILPMTAAAPAALSHLSSAGGARRSGIIRRIEGGAAVVTVLPSILVIAAGGFLLALFGQGFDDSRLLLTMAAVGATPYVLNTLYGYVLIADGRVSERFGFDLGLAAILLVGMVPLISMYGAEGYVGTQLLGFTAAAIALRSRIRESPKTNDPGLVSAR
ncbi:MAG TPA: oligosaccharide flippase family protein [Bryobacteraceae bacterium]|nr:oligosaccharide flippase family protein [Bryobacteraceae bacterium]